MHNHIARFVFVVALLCSVSAFAAGRVVPTGEFVPGEVLVKVQTGASANDIADIVRGADVDQRDRVADVKAGTLYRMHSKSLPTDALATALAKNPKVLYVEPNYVLHLAATPNDPSYSQLWGLNNTGQSIGGVVGTAGADIHAPSAWNVTTGSASIVVGVVDTGVDYNHPDLAANMWSNPGGKGNATCTAGTHGYNSITKTCNPMDDHYHGTHVAGTIGAVGNNSVGVVGVNWTTSIMALKFLSSSGSGTTADAISAIDFAVQAKIDGVNVRVLSNSWGGGGFSKALLDEINKAGENDILFVAAAGNDSLDNDLYPHYPSSYGTPNMIAVAATDNRDAMAYFSNWGVTSVHLGAPGLNVYSCAPGSGYQFLSGTSMATPHVSGVAALVLANSPSKTTAEVKSAILDNVDPIPSLNGKTVSGGRLNAAKALGVPPGPEFTLSASPTTRSVVRGTSGSYTITINPTGGFSGSVSLTISGLPTGAAGTFDPASATSTSTLTVTTNGSTTPVGTYTLIVTGTSGAITRATSVTLSVVTVPVSAPCPSFATVTYYGASGAANAVAAGDFNGDGIPDLVFAVPELNAIATMKGLGSANFQSPVYLVGNNAPIAVAVGDFNGDGKLDLVSANSTGTNVSVRIGNGDGTFASSVNYASGPNPFWVAVADVNADGKLDLVTANNGGSSVSILLGNGDGTFQSPVNYTAGSGAFWVSVGDVNRDGKLDLAVADFNANKISILLGNGDGTFQTHVDYAVGTSPSAVVIGDLNGDGKADLAVSNYGSNNASILLGNGDGTFQAAVNYATGSAPSSVAIFDVNGDGKADLAVSNSSTATVSLLAGNGSGTFGAAVNYTLPAGGNHVIAADLDGDGRSDLAAATTGYIAILKNNGSCSVNCGTIDAAVNTSTGAAPQAAAVGDFNRDGKLDLVAANNSGNSVSIALGNGDGTFGTATDFSAGTAPRHVAVADVNADGKLDLVVANSDTNHVSLLLGNGDGTFQGAVTAGTGNNPHAAAAGDFNRDGKLDLAVANSGDNNVSILLGNGNGTFQTAVNYAAGTTPESIAVGDVNRDGKLDLAVANGGSGNVSLLLGNGDGTFQAATSFTAGTTPMAVLLLDLNRDGKLDLAVANSGSNNVSIRLGNGVGGFASATSYTAGTNPYGLAAADFNDDGLLDLAVANHGSNNVSLLPGLGAGSFGTAASFAAATGPYAVAAGDFNRDGKPDLAVANGGSNNVSVLLNRCPVPDLSIAKSHSGSFTQGDTGRTYTITVSNVGGAATSGAVSVTDALPLGLAATAISGSGWTCTLSPPACSRSDALAAGASYPAITLTVSVAGGAPASVTNSATVAGGGELSSVNDTATDPTTVAPAIDLSITKTHGGSFTQGATNKAYTIIVRNLGGLPTTAPVSVTDTLPSGLTLVSMAGTGWNCGGATCTRSDALAGGANYPAITATVNVASNAPALVTNSATVSGGGDVNTSNNTASDPTVVWKSQTCGSFGPLTNYSSGYGGYAIAVADFNGDGKSDLVTANYYDSNVSILLGSGNGTFPAPVKYPSGGYSPYAVAAGDFNGDGKADLAVVNYYSASTAILIGNGDGTFGAATPYPLTGSSYPSSLTLNDFNGDGNLDVAVGDSSSGKIVVLLGNGNGTLQPAVTLSSTVGYPYYLVSADFDRDGKIDLAVADYYNYSLGILRGNGDGTFQNRVNYSAGSNPISVAVADLNGDGKLDLVVGQSYSSYLYVLLGNGDGTFQTAVGYSASYGASYVVTEDINGDGKPDIVAAGSSSSYVSLLLGNGDGTFQAPTNIYAYFYRPVVSDFNGDGQADIAGSNYSYVSVMLGACTDLRIAKSHSGNFTVGQTNATYSLVVSNSGGSSQGTVTVTDTLPSGLVPVSMSGSGWNCDLPTLTCTRSDSLGAGSSYGTIFVTVNVSNNAASTVTNTATVSGGGDSNPGNNVASDVTTILQFPDLTISKTHDGTFVQGQLGKIYTIIVANSGAAATSGTVTVTDTIPAGLTITGMSGAGWNCSVATRTCTRSDALAVNSAYAAITVTVNVDSNAPASVANFASVSGGGDGNGANNSVSDLTKIFIKPTNLAATAIVNSQVRLTWDAMSSATSYQVLRSTDNANFSVIGTASGNSYLDNGLAPNTAFFYSVRAIDATATGPLSSVDVAVTIVFTDDTIVANSTTLKVAHILELRAAINALRAAAGLGPATFTNASLTGLKIRAVHFAELRTALDAARSAVGLPAVAYTTTAPTAAGPIRAGHLRDLRTGVR